jgi:NitT/TauT family transport system permease protein/sulfonate transport system permease protein
MQKLSGFIFILFLLILIEIFCRLNWLDSVYFPPPTQIFVKLFELLFQQSMWIHIGFTLLRAFVGFSIAMVIAIPCGLLIGEFQPARNLLEPIIEMLRPLPSAAVIPVAILLFGIEDKMKIAVIIFGSIWSTIVGAIDGVRSVDSLLVDTGRLFQLNRLQLLYKIILPSALPTIFTGMRISLAIALILTVTSEMIAGSNGLGYFILDSQRSFAFREMFAGIIIVGTIGFISSKIFLWIDQKILFWYYASRTRSVT